MSVALFSSCLTAQTVVTFVEEQSANETHIGDDVKSYAEAMRTLSFDTWHTMMRLLYSRILGMLIKIAKAQAHLRHLLASVFPESEQ